MGDKEHLPGHDLNSSELTKSYVISLLISIPLLGLMVVIAQYHADMDVARIILWTILFVSVGNFLALVALEQFRAHMGSFTLPALLTACGLILFVVIVEGLSRFMPVIDFHWLYAVISMAIVFKYLAIFRERNLALKFYLGVNILALAALLSLGSTDRIALPF